MRIDFFPCELCQALSDIYTSISCSWYGYHLYAGVSHRSPSLLLLHISWPGPGIDLGLDPRWTRHKG
jgi:hypothetical protein